MSWDGALDIVAAVFLLAGSFLTLAAGVGLLRFPDLLARMHVGTKPQVLGVLLALTGFALRIRVADIIWTVALVAVFQLLTAPVAAHMVARAGYRTGKVHSDRLAVDELTEDLGAAVADGDPPEGPSIGE